MSNIQWTDVTDNPIVPEVGGWWCRKISPGCANCYAEKLNHNSFYRGNHKDYSGVAPKLIFKRELVHSWARMRKSKKHFVGSMTDLFGEWVPMEWQLELLDGMAAAPKQTFQLLTKRPALMQSAIEQWLKINQLQTLPSNIWAGTSVENQKCANERIPILDKIPAQIKFLSVEPLLGNVELGLQFPGYKIDWIIVGGESGADARSCKVEWISHIVYQCQKLDIPVFVKQLGSNSFSDFYFLELQDKKGGNISEFPEALKVRQFPVVERTKCSL